MKPLKIYSLIAAAAIALSAASCSSKSSTDTAGNKATPEAAAPVETVYTDAVVGQEITLNDTPFTLKGIIDLGAIAEDGSHYLYLDIDIRNETGTDYSISTLNNFLLERPDGTYIEASSVTQVAAATRLKQDYYSTDPVDVPSSIGYSGIIGGFIVPADVTSFNVIFFPTRQDQNDKDEAVRIPVTAANFSEPDPSHFKSAEESVPTIEYNAFVGQNTEVNSTDLTVNKVYTVHPDYDESLTFVFFDVTIKNLSDTDFELSALNNYLLELPGGTEVYSSMQAQLYANEIIKEEYFRFDPVEIKASGEFNGIMGGFVLDSNFSSGKLRFFPTLDDPTNKNNIIVVIIQPEDIVDIPADKLK